MDGKNVNVKEIMRDIEAKAQGITVKDDIPDFNGIPSDKVIIMPSTVNQEELDSNLKLANRDWYAAYDSSADSKASENEKYETVIKARLTPILKKKNEWSANIVRVLNNLCLKTEEISRKVKKGDPELMKIQLDELELKLFTAVRQMEVMNTRIAELEKALEKKGDK